jgi:hypothetical protein
LLISELYFLLEDLLLGIRGLPPLLLGHLHFTITAVLAVDSRVVRPFTADLTSLRLIATFALAICVF